MDSVDNGNDNGKYNGSPMSADCRAHPRPSRHHEFSRGGSGGHSHDHDGEFGRAAGGYNRDRDEQRTDSDGGGGFAGYSTHGGRRIYPPEEPAREFRPAQGSGAFVMPGGGDYSRAREVAEQHAGGDSSLFATALGFLSGREKDLEHGDVDEGEFVRNHRDIYGGEQQDGGGEGDRKDPQGLAQAAAMQALKKFTGGGGGGGGGASGQDQNAFIGLAMAEAAKLFDSQSSKGVVVCYSQLYSPKS